MIVKKISASRKGKVDKPSYEQPYPHFDANMTIPAGTSVITPRSAVPGTVRAAESGDAVGMVRVGMFDGSSDLYRSEQLRLKSW